ncbi:MAG TPA: biotin/lipoyl-containing protein, partial [Gaiellaceae bacterium]|nr:biotin/lipoyl-containing protein [Gaiellaceae bacterium]
AGKLPTAEQLRLAEILDKAGFAYLEISGGGCFDAAVRRGVESPWERIRAIRSRTTTPLAMALRGRFLVGSRPVGVELARRFVACAAESGIDVFRLHDPLNDVSNLREAADAITAAGREFDAGLVHSPTRTEDTDLLVEQSKRLPELGAARVLVHDPSGSLSPKRAADLVSAVREASGLPVGLYCQGAGGVALAATLEAARAGADLIACAVYPLALTLHRVSAESAATALAGLGLDTGVDVERVWEASDLVDEFIGDEPVTPTAPRVATLAAEHRLPPGLVAALDVHLKANAAADRMDEVLDELARIRAEVGSPPLASPIGQILASQALVHVLSAERYQTVVDELKAIIAGRFGSPPAGIDPTVERAVSLIGGQPPEERLLDYESAREVGEGLATSDEELCLLALFGDDAEPLLRTIRGRGQRDDDDLAGQEAGRAERIREIVRIVQESGVHEVTIEDAGTRVTVRRNEERSEAPLERSAGTIGELEPVLERAPPPGIVRVEAPMVGTFYRAPEPGAAPFVNVGDVVEPGQTVCILEAMKLMNEVKVEQPGTIRAIHAENAQPVEYGQLLFELEPALSPPVL